LRKDGRGPLLANDHTFLFWLPSPTSAESSTGHQSVERVGGVRGGCSALQRYFRLAGVRLSPARVERQHEEPAGHHNRGPSYCGPGTTRSTDVRMLAVGIRQTSRMRSGTCCVQPSSLMNAAVEDAHGSTSHLPSEYPPSHRIYAAFRQWGRQGRFEIMHQLLADRWRV
jgi:hypothetical protein